MARSTEQVQALREELQTWMKKYRLAADARWLAPEEFYNDQRKAYGAPPLLVLISEKAYDVTCDWEGFEPPPRPDAARIRDEFRAIVTRRGFDSDFEDGPVLCFRCAEEVQALLDQHEAKVREDYQRMREMEAAGWIREGEFTWVHPQDKERRVVYDPFGEEFVYSRKMVALIEAELRRSHGERARSAEGAT